MKVLITFLLIMLSLFCIAQNCTSDKGYKSVGKIKLISNDSINHTDTVVLVKPIGIAYDYWFTKKDNTLSKSLFDSVSNIFLIAATEELNKMGIKCTIESIQVNQTDVLNLMDSIKAFSQAKIQSLPKIFDFTGSRRYVLFFLDYYKAVTIGVGTGYGSGSTSNFVGLYSYMYMVDSRETILYYKNLHKETRVKKRKGAYTFDLGCFVKRQISLLPIKK